MTDYNRDRLMTWWSALDPETKVRLLALEKYEPLPEDVVPNLEDHSIHPVKGPDGGWVQPGELVEFLAEQRGKNP